MPYGTHYSIFRGTGVTKIIRIFGDTLFEAQIDVNYADGEDFNCSSNHFVDFHLYLWYTLAKDNGVSSFGIANKNITKKYL